MSEHTEERMQRCAMAMRKAFFAEFGEPETLQSGEVLECSNTLLTILAGDLVHGIAGLKKPEMPLRDAVMQLLDLWIATNREQVAEQVGKADVDAFLRGTQWQDLTTEEAHKVCYDGAAARLAREAGEQAEWDAQAPQDRANALCAVASTAFQAETEPLIVLAAAMQVVAGPMASAVLGVDAHRRAEHLQQMPRTIRRMVEATVDQVTPSGRPH